MLRSHLLLRGKNPFRFFFGMAAMAWGLGFLKELGRPIAETFTGPNYMVAVRTVPFPVWPNVLDVVGLFALGAYLLVEIFLP